MFAFFSKYVSEPVAIVLTGLCYALLLFLIYFCSFAPPAEFRYMAL